MAWVITMLLLLFAGTILGGVGFNIYQHRSLYRTFRLCIGEKPVESIPLAVLKNLIRYVHRSKGKECAVNYEILEEWVTAHYSSDIMLTPIVELIAYDVDQIVSWQKFGIGGYPTIGTPIEILDILRRHAEGLDITQQEMTWVYMWSNERLARLELENRRRSFYSGVYYDLGEPTNQKEYSDGVYHECDLRDFRENKNLESCPGGDVRPRLRGLGFRPTALWGYRPKGLPTA